MADVTVNNGTGLATVLLNDQPVKGMFLPGDLVVGLRPIFLGGEVAGGLAQKALMADSTLQSLRVDGAGRLITVNAPQEDWGVTTPVALANDTSAHALVGAQASGIKIALWGVDIVNFNAAPTSIIWTDAVSTVVLGRSTVPAWPTPGDRTWVTPLLTTAASALNYTLTGAVGANQLFVTPHWIKMR